MQVLSWYLSVGVIVACVSRRHVAREKPLDNFTRWDEFVFFSFCIPLWPFVFIALISD
jgi:hypothetical protein